MSTLIPWRLAFVGAFLMAVAAQAAPAATTTAASSITSTSAVLNGTGTPNGVATSGWFRYSTTNPGTCDDTFGTRLPATGGTDLGSGAVAVAYSITATGLTSGTTYFFCAIVSNSAGTALGTVLSFTIPGVPVVTTSAASSIAATTVTLNGSTNPVAATTTGWFRYSTTNPGTCNDTFGTRAPSSGGTNLGAGATAVPYTQGLTGLTPGTLYYFCALSSNSYGTAVGSVQTFTTLAAAPSVTTNTVSALTGTGVTLNATVNPGGADTTGWFRYDVTSPGTCNDTFGTRAPASGGSSVGSGTTTVVYSQAVTGLTAGITYYYCAIASNSVATSTGSVLSFTTPLPPTATTSAATFVTDTSAQLNGSGVPNGAAATGWFRYSATDPGTCNDTFGSRAPTSGSSSLGSGNTNQTFAQSISSLSSGVTYYYCAIVSNSEGTAFGAVLTLHTQGIPSTATVAASAITASSATLNGSTNPDSASTTGWFRYSTTSPGSCNDTFGTRAPSSGGAALGLGSSPVSYAQGISSLTPGTTYYYCAISNNSFGYAYGSILSFTTSVAAPTVSTSSPSPLTGTTATLLASVNPGGATTTGWFRYSTISPGTCNDTFGTRAPATGTVSLGSGTSSTSLSQAITGLTAGTLYYVCALATNSVSTTLGNVTSFTTPLPPGATTSAASSVGDTYAYLNGSGIPNGAASTGWFRYSTTDPGSCNDTFGSRVPNPSGGTSLGSGYTSQSFSQYISSLSPGTTYYYCAIVSSTEGTVFGAVLTFGTQGPPTTTTVAASSIVATSATLNGTVDPNGSSTSAWFRYATSTPTTCNDSFGTRYPSSGGASMGSGTNPLAYQYSITSLLPGTTYYFCSIATNSLGTTFGSVLSFTTNIAAPTVSTGSPSPLRGTTATLQASVNPGGADTTGWFRYDTVSPGVCNDTFGTRAPTTGGPALGAGTSSTALSQAVTGLTAGVTYYVCAIASNSVGTTYGGLTSFTTPLPPTATTSAASSVGDTYAYLNGSGIPNGASATGWFRYSTTDPGACDDTFGSRVPTLSGGTTLGSGYTSQSFSQYISGLSSGATYYFCAIVSSSEGTTFGSVLTMRTQGPPSATTVAASSIGSTSAALNGSVNPSGASTSGWFRYSTSTPTVCNDTFGTRIPSSGGTSLGSGTTAVPYVQSVSSFLPGTTYYYCAIASNALGNSFGAVLSFTTATAAPTVSTGSPSPLTGTAATLQATSNPGGAATTGWFRYATVSPGTCNDTFGTRAPASGAVTVGSGSTTVSFSQAATGLTAGVTYYVCAIAMNAVGTTFGNITSFTTPLLPTATTTAASSVGDTYAYLNGSGIPNGASTTAWFRYSASDPGACDDAFGSRVPTPSGGTSLGSGYTSQTFSQYISGLSSGATYYYCAIVSSAEGTAFGSVLTFRTQGPPSATTVAASSIGSTSATLNGSVNPSGATSTGWFRYSTSAPASCNDSFGTRVPSSGGASLGSGTSAVSYTQSVTSFLPGTTYYYCALASNALGTAYGAVLSFTMSTAAPTVSTNSPSPLTGTAATLSASVNPGGTATTVWFRYATVSPGTCNDTFGTRSPATGAVSVAAGTSTVTASQATTGLTAGTTYYYCAIAANAVGTVFANITSFTTPLPPTATTTAASSIGDSYVYLNGSGIPNGATSTGWFRYSATDPGTCDDTFGSRAPTPNGGSSLGSGYTSQTYSQYISSLSPGTTYYYCAIVSSAEGTAFGSVLTLRTQGAPTAVTTAASNVAATTVTMNGTANPNGASSTGWFRYSSTNPGICNDSFGTRVPSSGGTALGTGTSAVPYAQNLSGLTPAATYYYCSIANNTYGTAVGAVLSFTTASAAPTVTTNSPSVLTSTGATLSATVNPGGAATTGWFRYDVFSPGTCNDTFGTRAPATGAVSIAAGASNVSLTQAVTGLNAGTTYYVCAFASNAVGQTNGSVVSFTVPLAPTVASLAATPITSTTATLNGSGNPNGNSTTGWFRYSTTNPVACSDSFGTRAPATGGSSLGSGNAAVAFSQAITGLTPGTLYYACAIASSAIATVFGEVLTFTTPAIQPVATTLAASGIAPDAATLNASGNPGGGASTGWFRYSTTNPGSCTDAFGTRTPATGGTDLGSGNSAVPFTANLTGLTASTTYYYCAIVSNGVGTSFGSVLSFNTAVPLVTTQAATAVANTSVTLNGSANPNGTTATGWFRYSTTNPGSCNDTFGTRTPTTGGSALGTGTTAVPFSQGVTGLAALTTYYFCAIASNTIGTNVGTVLSFTTPSSPVVTTDPASSLSGSGNATLNGTANPNGASAAGWFRYAATSPGTCNDTFGTRAPATGGATLGSGTTGVSWAQVISGLTPGATYFYCALASNTYGTAMGTVGSFTMPTATPIVTTGSATQLTGTTAQLGGSANPNGDATSAWFRYSTSNPGACTDAFGTRVPASGGTDLGSGTTAASYTLTASSLQPGTTYYFCAIASNSSGTSVGQIATFTTPALPSTTTSAATSLADTSVTLNGASNPNGSAATGWFRYSVSDPGSCNDTFGTRAPATGGTALGSGSSAATFSANLTGLIKSTTYYFCALASNAGGLSTGTVLSFTTTAPASVTTSAATAITSGGATMNGSITPNGTATTGWFRYSSTDPGACNDTFGTRAPASGGANAGSGSSAVSYSLSISALTPGTTYYFCAVATNASGTSFGAVLSFTTDTSGPSVVTNTASLVTGTSATLSGSASPGGAATTGWFRYDTSDPGSCNDTFGTRAPSSGGSSLGSGVAFTDYSQALTGLLPGTTYFVCAIASNASGKSFGSVVSFTTAGPPTVVTAAATSIDDTNATLNASASPNGSATTGWFRYATVDPGSCSDTFGTRAPSSGGDSIGSGPGTAPWSRPLTGLQPGTTYYFCALASNQGGLSTGSVLSFRTTAPPSVTTSAATSIISSTATLNGSAVANGSATTGWFRYSTTNPGSCSDAFGTRAPPSGGSSVGSGQAATAYSQALTGLAAGATYYFCALAGNSSGTSFGAVLSFTTQATAPTVTTNVPLTQTGTTATLAGAANPGGADATAWFRYSTTNPGSCNDTFGTRAPQSGGSAIAANAGTTGFSLAVSGLTPATTYYVCALASNSAGQGVGGVVSFATATPPSVITSAATSLTDTTAVVNASANPNGSGTAGWFRYATVDPGTCDDTFGIRAPASGGDALGAGAAAVTWSRTLTGLQAGTTYYYCALASNLGGLSTGSVLSFRTTAPPTVTTNGATSVTSTTATLNGSAVANGSATTGWFRYSTTNPGGCSDTFGTRAPASGGSAVGSGQSAASFAQAISGLTPGTTYYFCALASNGSGTSLGAVLSLTTSAMAPMVVTGGPLALTGTTATFGGSANPGGADATAWFRYATTNPGTCNDAFGTRAPQSGGSAIAAGASTTDFTQAVSGLTPATTYYLCALASNSAGLGVGAVVTFTTPAPPTVATTAATSITPTSVVLNGAANPNGSASTGWFRYDTTDPGTCNDSFGTRAPASAGNSVGGGTSSIPFALGVSGLASNTIYFFCALASNAGGVTTGAVLSFRTLAAPTVTTGTATLVTATSATISGHANPNGTEASGWFRYDTANPIICNDTFGTRAPSSGGTALGNGSGVADYTQALTGLQPGTTYYFCALASNTIGTSFGQVQTFTTAAALPIVTTLAASNFGAGTAALNATATPGGGSTTGWFRYDTTNPGSCNDSFGVRAPAQSGVALGAGQGSAAFAQSINGLLPGSTYYFCALASNASGTGTGAVLSFTTPSLPTITTAQVTSITDSSATFNGLANPNGSAALGWFRYDAVNPGSCNDSFGTRLPASGGTSLGAGTSAVPYFQVAADLQPDTVYYFCALASNTAGLSTGTLSSFRTPGAPDVTTGPATAVLATSATVSGSATPNGAAATGWFRYGTIDPGNCNDTFGTRTPGATDAPLASGTNPVSFSQSLTGLLPGTTYYVCALARNDYGLSAGTVESFTTSALAPTVATGSASLLGGTTVQFTASASPNGADAMGWFRYGTLNPGTCSDAFGTRAPTTGGTALGAGNAVAPFTQTVASLAPGTTYYFCAVATNAAGTSFGQLLSFTTLPLPTVTTLAATVVVSDGATLNASATPNGSATTGWFRYATSNPGTCDDTFGARAPATGGTSLGAGTTAASYLQTLTGLQPNTTYFFCALASNAAGTATGTISTFRTPDAPSVTTSPATTVSAGLATLNGTANPNGASATGWFRYDTSDPGACNDLFGVRTPTGGDAALGAGTTAVPFAQSLSGLAPGTTYWFCAVASNAYGKSFGNVTSFTTPVLPPTVTTVGATLLAGTTVQLQGTATPNGDIATGWFRYSTLNPGSCNDVFGVRAPSGGGTPVAPGTPDISFSEIVDQLLPGTLYYFCAIASNGAGKSFGQVLSFETLPLPTVTTLPATAVAAEVATINGVGTPNGAATTGWFRYANVPPATCTDSFGTRVPASGGVQLGAGTASVSYSQVLSGLSPGTTYYYCAIVTNAGGIAVGGVQSFTTTQVSGPPVVVTDPATALTSNSALLNGEVDPNHADALAWFRFSTSSPGTCNDSFGTRQPMAEGTPVPASGGSAAFAEAISGLLPGTLYYFCAIASNANGLRFGAVLTFSTTPIAPAVTTLPPTNVGDGGATLNGSVIANGGETTAWFRYDTVNPGTCNDSFGTQAPMPAQDVGAGTTVVSYSASLTGLAPGVTYYYCAIASNSRGTSTGEVLSFTQGAPAPTIATDAATEVTDSAAKLAGTVGTNGADTLVWFRWGTEEPASCSDFFGQRSPSSGGTTVPAGGADVAFTQVLSALNANTTYYYCAAGSNAGGATFGEVRSFKTLAVTPDVRTIGAASANNGTYLLNGGANPHGSETTAWFRYGPTDPGTCSDTFGTRTDEAKDAALGSGSTEAAFSAPVTGLAGGKYFFCAIARNEAGTTYGQVVSFEVASAPAPVRPSGCNCGSGAGPSAVLWLAPLLLVGWRRRRRVIAAE